MSSSNCWKAPIFGTILLFLSLCFIWPVFGSYKVSPTWINLLGSLSSPVFFPVAGIFPSVFKPGGLLLFSDVVCTINRNYKYILHSLVVKVDSTLQVQKMSIIEQKPATTTALP